MKDKRANVDGVSLFVRDDWEVFEPNLSRICNGVGSDSWPDKLRELLDQLPYLYPASKVHDVDYEAGGDSFDRKRADKRFRRNCIRVARAKIGPFWKRILSPSIRRKWILALGLIEAAYIALRIGGGFAWRYETHDEWETWQ